MNNVRVKTGSMPEDYPYSSDASYISKKTMIACHELIPGMISKDKKGFRKKCR